MNFTLKPIIILATLLLPIIANATPLIACPPADKIADIIKNQSGLCERIGMLNGRPVDYFNFNISFSEPLSYGRRAYYDVTAGGIPSDIVEHNYCKTEGKSMADKITYSYAARPISSTITCFYAPYGTKVNDKPYVRVFYTE